MKTTNLKLIFTTAILIILSNSCVSDDDYNTPQLECNQPNLTPNKSVQEIIAASGNVITQYPYDDIIEAYVVSSDKEGNFFKSISLQTLATETTLSVGFSVPIDAYNTYIDYRVGTKVFIKLKDLYTDIYYGSMRVGGIYINSYGYSSVGRLLASSYKNQLIASCSYLNEDNFVKKVTVPELLNDANLNTLVEISEVKFTKEAVGKHYYEPANDTGGATNWKMTDSNGKTFIFRTSSYANFAGNIVPSGIGTVRGILTKYGSDYQFLARYESDIKLGE
ncbi:MAG: DUF5689 domain-containing protein [Flavobacterium sp.]